MIRSIEHISFFDFGRSRSVGVYVTRKVMTAIRRHCQIPARASLEGGTRSLIWERMNNLKRALVVSWEGVSFEAFVHQDGRVVTISYDDKPPNCVWIFLAHLTRDRGTLVQDGQKVRAAVLRLIEEGLKQERW